MGKKKKKAQKPWCYYCDREFDEEKVLIQHQKAKHFKCHVCHKKLSTAGGMVVHVLQVHKESVTAVPNAKSGRESVDIEIFGMEGVPVEALAERHGEDPERPAKAQKTDNSEAPSHYQPPPDAAASFNNPSAYSNPNYWRPPVGSAPFMGRLPTWPHMPPISNQQQGAPQYLGSNIAPNPSGQPSHPQAQFTRALSATQPLFPISQPGPPTGHTPPPPPPPTGTLHPLFPLRQPQPSNSSVPASVVSNLSHIHSSGPAQDYSIIPPAPSQPQPHAPDVYLVWDDESMSMEERRLSLPRHQVAPLL